MRNSQRDRGMLQMTAEELRRCYSAILDELSAERTAREAAEARATDAEAKRDGAIEQYLESQKAWRNAEARAAMLDSSHEVLRDALRMMINGLQENITIASENGGNVCMNDCDFEALSLAQRVLIAATRSAEKSASDWLAQHDAELRKQWGAEGNSSFVLPWQLDAITKNLVCRFAAAMVDKLLQAQLEGRDGWDSPDWQEECTHRLNEHVAKGDPRDVANFCAFMWHHGWPTTAPTQHDAEMNARIARLEEALKFYADGSHFVKFNADAWDTCSGEPMNFHFDENDTAQVEDGTVAKQALQQSPSESLATIRDNVLEEIAEYVGRNLMSCGEYAEEIRKMKGNQ